MKKIISLMMCLVMAIVLMPTSANAAESTEKVITVGTEEALRAALENVQISTEYDVVRVELTDDIEVNTKSSKVSRPVGIALSGEGSIIIDGKGQYSISTSAMRTLIEIYATGEEVLDVTFLDVTVESSYNKVDSVTGPARGIDTRTGNINLTFDGATLQTTGSSNTQALTIGGSYTGAIDVMVKNNSTIFAKNAGYGIITFNKVNLTIDSSDVTGYAALYMKEGSSGSIVKVLNGSILTGDNNFDGSSDNFGTISFEDDGITVEIEDSKIEATGDGSASQVIFGQGGNMTPETIETPNDITIFGDSEISAKPEGYVRESDELEMNIAIQNGVSSNLEIPTEYLQYIITLKGTENGIVISDKATAIAGDTVTLTTTANEGYELEKIEVLNVTDDKLIDVKDGKFIMPTSDVEITVTYKKIVNPNTNDGILLYLILASISFVGLAIAGTQINKKRLSN